MTATRCHVLAPESPHPADQPLRVDCGPFGLCRPAVRGVILDRIGVAVEGVVMVQVGGLIVFRRAHEIVPVIDLAL